MLKAILSQDEFSKLDEGSKAHYAKQDNGSHLLQVEPSSGFSLENVAGLKTALSSERTAREKAEAAIKGFEGIDPVKAKEAMVKVEEFTNGKVDEKIQKQIEAREAQLVEKHNKELNAATAEAERFQKVAIASTKGRAISDALAKHKGAKFLSDTIEKFVKAEFADDGSVVLKVMDEKGNVRISSASGSVEPMSVDEYVEGMRNSETYAPAFEGTPASGGGSHGGSGGGAHSPHVISRADARIPAKYRAAKEAAQKSGVELQIAN